MFLEKIKTPGLAHLSYILGSGNQAVVIDPRRDIDIYIDIARQHDFQISHIFETHRNEDLISGSALLAKRCGAEVLHGPHADGEIQYATTVTQGHQVKLDSLTLEILETPGHTKDSVCILVFDNKFDEGAVGIFTGDTLFVGDVGRTDFYPDESHHVAGLLYDSLQKIKSQAPQAIIYPAHGAGSVCGDGMAEREFSTVGHEINNNPLLAIQDREEFIHKKVAEKHYIPPYFSEMERLNMQGATDSPSPGEITPITAKKLSEMHQQGYKLIDVRSIESYLGSHLPHSFCLPIAMITAYAGWLLASDDRLIIIANDNEMASTAALHLARIGYDHAEHYISANLAAIAASGKPVETLEVVNAQQTKQLIDENWTLLDVRKITEYEKVHIPGSEHIFLGHLADKISGLSPKENYITMCASGMRATVAGAYLQANGFENVTVFMGSMGAWQAMNFPVEKA